MADFAGRLTEEFAQKPHGDLNAFVDALANEARERGVKLKANRKKLLQNS